MASLCFYHIINFSNSAQVASISMKWETKDTWDTWLNQGFPNLYNFEAQKLSLASCAAILPIQLQWSQIIVVPRNGEGHFTEELTDLRF